MYHNIYRLVGETFLIRTVAGWRKLLKYWYCYKNTTSKVRGIKEPYPSSYPVLVYCRNFLFEQNRVDVEFEYISKDLSDNLIDDLNLEHDIKHYDER